MEYEGVRKHRKQQKQQQDLNYYPKQIKKNHFIFERKIEQF